jgi:hypothetical protein
MEGEIADRFLGHGIEEKTEPRLNILAVNTTVFLVSDTAPIIDHTEQHQRGRRSIRAKPQGLLYFLKVRGAKVEMPAIVAVLSLEADSAG